MHFLGNRVTDWTSQQSSQKLQQLGFRRGQARASSPHFLRIHHIQSCFPCDNPHGLLKKNKSHTKILHYRTGDLQQKALTQQTVKSKLERGRGHCSDAKIQPSCSARDRPTSGPPRGAARRPTQTPGSPGAVPRPPGCPSSAHWEPVLQTRFPRTLTQIRLFPDLAPVSPSPRSPQPPQPRPARRR